MRTKSVIKDLVAVLNCETIYTSGYPIPLGFKVLAEASASAEANESEVIRLLRAALKEQQLRRYQRQEERLRTNAEVRLYRRRAEARGVLFDANGRRVRIKRS